MDILEEIVAAKRLELAEQKRHSPFAAVREMVTDLPVINACDFRSALSAEGCSIIAEVKKHSPSRGKLREEVDPLQIARCYEQNGAKAISVLTERTFFHGKPEYLETIKKEVAIPVLRKDFIVDSYQIYETKLLGADALLLIAGLLPPDILEEFIKTSMSLQIWPLVEVHSQGDLDIALAAGAEIIGINNRNLKDFKTDIRNTLDLLPNIPAGKTIVSESGINNKVQIAILRQAGVHAFLIGETLMSAPDPGRKLRELQERGE